MRVQDFLPTKIIRSSERIPILIFLTEKRADDSFLFRFSRSKCILGLKVGTQGGSLRGASASRYLSDILWLTSLPGRAIMRSLFFILLFEEELFHVY